MNRTYFSKTNQITTILSGDRIHYRRRPKYVFDTLSDYNSKFGETLYELGDRYFGKEEYWDILLDFNININPMDLYVGQILKIPSRVIENDNTNVVVL